MVGTSTPHRNARIDEVEETHDTESIDVFQFAESGELYATRPLRTEPEYEAALTVVRRVLGAPHEKGSLEFDALDLLSLLIQDYEERNVPELGKATPQEIVQFMAEQKGLEPGRLATIMGGKSRLSEFINRKRALSINQLKALRNELGIPADLLIE
jgi:HTH-type transcriptional regulator/antitoxin HigA